MYSLLSKFPFPSASALDSWKEFSLNNNTKRTTTKEKSTTTSTTPTTATSTTTTTTSTTTGEDGTITTVTTITTVCTPGKNNAAKEGTGNVPLIEPNTTTRSTRNSSYDLRKTPAVPKAAVSPWLQSSAVANDPFVPVPTDADKVEVEPIPADDFLSTLAPIVDSTDGDGWLAKLEQKYGDKFEVIDESVASK